MEELIDNRRNIDLKHGKGIQVGDGNKQTNIFYGDDPDEEKIASTIDANSPYLGLASFTAETSKNFYGRKKLVESLLQELEKDNLIFLLGASGSGKSSLVKAGMIPKLIQSNINKKPFIELSFVPSDDPFGYFFEKLPIPPSEKINLYEKSEIYNNKVNLHSIIERVRLGKNDSWLIFIDQFEEILTTTSKEEGLLFIQFLDNLISSLRKSQDNSIKLILAMRTDFLDQFMNAFPDFVVTIQSDGRKPFSYITPMTDRELKLVIKNPAATHGVNVEQDLIEEIINDFRGESRSLPLLQYTLDLLWQKDNLSDRLLNQETYEDIGKVGGALQQQAEKIYQHFESKRLEKSVEYIFVRLITITADGKRVSKRESKSRFGGELGTIVEELVKEHRLLISGRQLGKVEIAHESLISSWTRLQDWIAKYEKEIILERQLVESAQTWWEVKADEKRAISELWTGVKLGRILKLIKEQSLSNLGAVTNRFIRASVDHYQQLQKAEAERLQKEIDSELSLASSLGGYASALFDSHRELEAFVEAIRAGRILQKHKMTEGRLINTLNQLLNRGRERNRLEARYRCYVCSVSLSANGKTLASGNDDNTIKIWNVETGIEICTLEGHTSPVYRVSFSSDGKTLASGSNDNTIKIWNVETGIEICTLEGHKSPINSVSLSADGKTLASGSDDNTIKIWNVETGIEIRTLEGHKSPINSVSLNADGKTLASGSDDNTIKIWNVETGIEIRTLVEGHEARIVNLNKAPVVSLSANGKTLASGSDDATIKIWNVETGAVIWLFEWHKDYISEDSLNSVSLSADGKTLAGFCGDNTIKIWNMETGAEISTLEGHKDYANQVSLSADGKTLASFCGDNTIKIWNVKTAITDDFFHSISLSADGKTLATSSFDGSLKLWNVETGVEICTIEGHEAPVFRVSFSSDGKTLASCCEDNTLILWNVETGAEICTLEGQENSINGFSLSADGMILAVCIAKIVKLWNVETGVEILTIKGQENSINVFSLSPDGKILATGSDDTVKLWNVETGTEICTLYGHTSFVFRVSFSGDGKTLASCGGNNTIKLWNVEIGSEVCTFKVDEGSSTVSLSADGNTLANYGYDNTIKLWNVETGLEVYAFKVGEGSFTVSLSADSKMLAASDGSTISFWNLDLDSLMARSCDWVRNYLTHNPNISESDRHLCDGIGTKK